MPIFDGLDEIEQIFDGTDEIESVFDGTDEIWSNNKVFYLGYGRSWDAKPYIDKIQNLTADNFFFIRTGGLGSASDWISSPGVGYSVIYYSSGYSNGVYSHYGSAQSKSANSNHCVVCTKPSKLKYLGAGQVNVKALYPNDYQNFTVDNFLCKNPKYGAWRDLLTSGDEDDTFSSQTQVQISYNQSTGIVSAYYVANGQTRGPGHDRDASATAAMPIYLYKGQIRNL